MWLGEYKLGRLETSNNVLIVVAFVVYIYVLKNLICVHDTVVKVIRQKLC